MKSKANGKAKVGRRRARAARGLLRPPPSSAPANGGEDLELPESLLQLPPFVMIQILRAGRRMAERTPEGPGLPTISVLACLVEFGPQSQREISERLRFDPSDVVEMIDDVEARGLAVRERDPADRRRYAVAATPAGRRWLRKRLADAGERAKPFLLGLDATERRQLLSLLQRVLAHHDARVPAHYRDA
jgi:MarR family transcriptional regulator, lower aerobic nicotinate degradation pathway regulator